MLPPPASSLGSPTGSTSTTLYPEENSSFVDREIDEDEPRPASPAPSVYSYASSLDRELILRDVHGRTLNNTSDVWSCRCCFIRNLADERVLAVHVACR